MIEKIGVLLSFLLSVLVGTIVGGAIGLYFMARSSNSEPSHLTWQIAFKTDNSNDCEVLPEVLLRTPEQRSRAIAPRGVLLRESAGQLGIKGTLNSESDIVGADLWFFERPGRSSRSITIGGNFDHTAGAGVWRDQTANEKKVICKGTWKATRQPPTE